MSERFGTEPVQPVLPLRDRSAGDLYHNALNLPSHAVASRGHAGDIPVVVGLPPGLQRPEVLAALTPLLDEMERLRQQVSQDHHHLGWLEHQYDAHPVAPCLSRRAFLREVESWLSGGGGGCVAVLHVGGVEAARRRYGLSAGDMALQHAASVITANVRAGDPVGCLGGSDFGLVLPNAVPENAKAKLALIVAGMTEPLPVWHGADVALKPVFGVWQPQPGQTAREVIDAADGVLLGA